MQDECEMLRQENGNGLAFGIVRKHREEFGIAHLCRSIAGCARGIVPPGSYTSKSQ